MSMNQPMPGGLPPMQEMSGVSPALLGGIPPQDPASMPPSVNGAIPMQAQQQSMPSSTQPQPTADQLDLMLQMHLKITMIALLTQTQNVIKSQANLFEKMKSIPLLSQSIVGLHNSFMAAEQLEFEKQKPDNGQFEAELEAQKMQHQHALDLMAQNHEEQLAQRKFELEEQKMQLEMQIKQMEASMKQQSMQQDQQHKEDIHESNLETQQIQKAQTIQAAQQQEENHQQTMSIAEKQSEADVKAASDKDSDK
jgi:hypothetical protein